MNPTDMAARLRAMREGLVEMLYHVNLTALPALQFDCWQQGQLQADLNILIDTIHDAEYRATQLDAFSKPDAVVDADVAEDPRA